MSLDGLRAWIGLVEQKLAKRTRVFLVVVAIAIGVGGAALYLAIDAQNSAVSESDLQSVRDELADEESEAPGATVTELEAKVEALQGEVATLRGEVGSGAGGQADSGTGDGGTGNSAGDADESGNAPGAATGGATAPRNQQQLEELAEKAQKEAQAGE